MHYIYVKYDKVLKDLMRTAGSRFIEILTGAKVTAWLNVELVGTRSRVMDLLGRLSNGGLFHVELQATNIDNPGLRMLDYSVRTEMETGEEPICLLLYVGEEPMRMKGKHKWRTRTFEFRCTDIREVDAELLLKSPRPEDHVLALLCGSKDPLKTIPRVLRRIAKVKRRPKRAELLAQVLIVCGLRKFEPIVRKEVEKMPVLIDMNRVPFWRESFESGEKKGLHKGIQKGLRKGRTEGSADMLRTQILQKFRTMPKWVDAKMEAATRQDLKRWGKRILACNSLREVFQ